MVCFSNLRWHQANFFCQQNELPLLRTRNDKFDLQLIFHDDLIELFDRQLNTTITIDFLKGHLAHRQQFGGGRGQAIARAIGMKSGITPSVLDVTAGMAGDAFVLATLGCPVTMIERSAIMTILIEDAIQRASLNESFTDIIAQGFTIIHQDARDYIKEQLTTTMPESVDVNLKTEPPEVIYLDPMYPKRKKSALVKKDMQILQRLHPVKNDADELLELALTYAKKRVVVKRPIQAETLNDRQPDTSIKTKKTRYDIYTLQKMSRTDVI